MGSRWALALLALSLLAVQGAWDGGTIPGWPPVHKAQQAATGLWAWCKRGAASHFKLWNWARIGLHSAQPVRHVFRDAHGVRARGA